MAYFRYYRSVLTTAERSAYDRFIVGLSRREDEITLPVLNPTQVHRIMVAVNLDYPDMFYLDSKSVPYTMSSIETVVKMPYALSFSQAVKTKKEIDHEVSLITAKTAGMSPLELEAYLHDTLVRRCTYGTSSNHPAHAHNLIGPFLEGKCVCEGYAKAFQYLADKVKLPSFVVTGSAHSPGEVPGPHAWNIVKPGRKAYHLDVTFDHLIDGSYCSRAYFNLSDAEIFRDHQVSRDFPLPKCAVNGAVLPIVSSTTNLVKYLRKASGEREKHSELRLTRSFTPDEIDNMIRRKLSVADHSWYNRIESMSILGGYTLLITWRGI